MTEGVTERCWFCDTRPADGDPYEVHLHGEVQRTSEPRVHAYMSTTRLTWRKETVLVPRCSLCEKAQQRIGVAVGLYIVLAVVGLFAMVGGLALADRLAPDSPWGALSPILTLGLVIVGFVWLHRRSKAIVREFGMVRDTSDVAQYGRAKQLLDAGWALGEEPPG